MEDKPHIPVPPPKKRKKNLTIFDPTGEWHEILEDAIRRNYRLLAPDERNPKELLKLFIKNGSVCIRAIRDPKFKNK